MKGWTPSKLPSRLKRDDVATPQSSWQRLALMWQKCGIALKRLVNVRVNRSLSDLTDQTNRCLADTVNSLHRCQAQVTAGAYSHRPGRKLNQTSQSLRFTFKQEKKGPRAAEPVPLGKTGIHSLAQMNTWKWITAIHLVAVACPHPTAPLAPFSACAPCEPHKVTHAGLYATACSHFNLCVVGCGPSWHLWNISPADLSYCLSRGD